MKTKPIYLLAVLLVSLAGCAKPIMPIMENYSAPERLITKSYTIGEQQTKFVGEQIVLVKDYTVRRKTTNKISPSGDFIIGDHEDPFLVGKKDVPIPIAGLSNFNNVEYYLLQSRSSVVLIPITKDGDYLGGNAMRVTGDFHSGNEVIGRGTGGLKIDPAGIKFNMVNDEEIDAKAGYVNFEILFTGVNSDTLNLLYREYTRDDMARPAYHQNLIYTRTEKFIRFKNLRIELLNVNSESITYKVIED